MLYLKRVLTLAATLTVALSLVSQVDAATTKKKKGAAKKPTATDRISSDPDAATYKEAALLKWGPVNPPRRGKNAEFFVRGAYVSAVPIEGEKDGYTLTIFPIEVVNNEYRYINLDSFTTGLQLPTRLPKQLIKKFESGGVVEVNQYYETVDEGGIGHAKMVGFIFHQDIQPYPAGPEAYIKKGGLEQEQYLNALKGVEMYSKKPSDEEFKIGLDALASSSPNPEVKTKATQMLSQMFNAQPSGRALLAAVPETPPPATEKEKKSEKKN